MYHLRPPEALRGLKCSTPHLLIMCDQKCSRLPVSLWVELHDQPGLSSLQVTGGRNRKCRGMVVAAGPLQGKYLFGQYWEAIGPGPFSARPCLVCAFHHCTHRPPFSASLFTLVPCHCGYTSPRGALYTCVGLHSLLCTLAVHPGT